jgi:hypothetical protein
LSSVKVYGAQTHVPVLPHQLPIFWERIKPGVFTVWEQSPYHEWTPSSLYDDIYRGQCRLFLVLLRGKYIGFVATQIERIANRNTLLIRTLFLQPTQEYDPIVSGWPFLEDLARESNCTALVMSTPRVGWLKRLKKIGMAPYQTDFIKELPNEQQPDQDHNSGVE